MAENNYQLLDSGSFRKLEKIGKYRLIRPAAQAVWQPRLSAHEWEKADAEFLRRKNGEGEWIIKSHKLPEQWQVCLQSLKMDVKLTDFGHVGIFPEHHEATELQSRIAVYRGTGKEFKLLNLFAYTGALTLLAASAGAQVVHLDASKTSVAWARQNAANSGLGQLPIRWITDDVKKFISREVRRGARYQGIILDPPSFGRGPKGEVWKIEEDLPILLQELQELMAEDCAYLQLSAHSPGFTPMVLENLLAEICPPQAGSFQSFEMFVRETPAGRPLPSGACCLWTKEDLP